MTKIAPGGLAEQDGRLRLGDKLLSVRLGGREGGRELYGSSLTLSVVTL